MEFSDFAAVPAIVVLVYLAAYFIKLIPGEFECEALALGALRVLRGEIKPIILD